VFFVMLRSGEGSLLLQEMKTNTPMNSHGKIFNFVHKSMLTN
jgi:hypothetical protein